MDCEGRLEHTCPHHNVCEISGNIGMSNFKVGDVVTLIEDLLEEGLHAGQIGTVVFEFEEPLIAYETEFTDEEGRSLAQLALLPQQLKPYIPHQ